MKRTVSLVDLPACECCAAVKNRLMWPQIYKQDIKIGRVLCLNIYVWKELFQDSAGDPIFLQLPELLVLPSEINGWLSVYFSLQIFGLPTIAVTVECISLQRAGDQAGLSRGLFWCWTMIPYDWPQPFIHLKVLGQSAWRCGKKEKKLGKWMLGELCPWLCRQDCRVRLQNSVLELELKFHTVLGVLLVITLNKTVLSGPGKTSEKINFSCKV